MTTINQTDTSTKACHRSSPKSASRCSAAPAPESPGTGSSTAPSPCTFAANAPSTEEVAGAVHGVLAAQQTAEDTGTVYTPAHAAQAAAAPSVDEVEEVTVSSTPPDATAEADEFPETVIAQPTA